MVRENTPQGDIEIICDSNFRIEQQRRAFAPKAKSQINRMHKTW